MSTPKTAARVARFRAEFDPDRYNIHEESAAFLAAFGAISANALDAIEQGETAEAVAWATLGQLYTFRYRKAAPRS